MAKESADQILLIIKEKFTETETFDTKKLKSIFANKNLNISYFMNVLVKKGKVTLVRRNLWSLPKIKKTNLTPLYISRAERKILDAILKIELKTENGISRFPLGKVKDLLSEEEKTLVTDLFPKLSNLGIISCVGTGACGKILEINDDLFLKYLTDSELIKEVSLTDLEIDQKIKNFLSEEEIKSKNLEEISEKLVVVESELFEVVAQIESLEKIKESLEKDIKGFKEELNNNQNQTNGNDEKEFIRLMANMNPEKRLIMIKKILV